MHVSCNKPVLLLYVVLQAGKKHETHLTVHQLQTLGAERFDYKKAIKHGEYSAAKAAYHQFIKEFGLRSKFRDTDQIITLSAIAFGRAIDASLTNGLALQLTMLHS
jgi:hypothetical protein